MADKRVNELTQISSAPASGVLPIDVPGSTDTNGITVDNLARTMPAATIYRSGMMESSVLKSIYSFASIIQPRSTFNTEIKTGGLILVQNTGCVHDIAVAIMYAEGGGKVISEAPYVSFFHGSDYIDVRKEGANESIQIVNNTDVVQHFAFRIICSII